MAEFGVCFGGGHQIDKAFYSWNLFIILVCSMYPFHLQSMSKTVIFVCIILLSVNNVLFAEPDKGKIGSIAFTSSNLPIIVITTENHASIPNEPKIKAHMGIIYNGEGKRNYLTDSFNEYDGVIGIELRGNASAGFPKKPYLLETRDENGENNNVSLLGMPKENDWILRSVYIDKTLMRDAIGMFLSQETGRWACRTRHCELVLNDEYAGLYILMESIKPDRNRLDIAKMTVQDISGDAVTGGYIWEVAHERPNSFGKRRELKYPKKDNVQTEQLDYIRKYDDDFREVMSGPGYADSLSGYPAWINPDSFIDEILVQEATKNSDAYGWSSYFHKDRQKRMCAGPVWDFDQAMSNSTWAEGYIWDEWIIEKNIGAHPPFWKKLFRDRQFKKRLVKRWEELRQGPFHTQTIMTFIDSTAAYLFEAQERNFRKWPILGVEIWRSPPGVTERDTYQKEVDYLKDYMVKHLQWMDDNLVSVPPAPPGPVDLDKGLMGYYPFDEGNGLIARNASPHENRGPDGIFVPDPATQSLPQWIDGVSGSALLFQSSNQAHVDLGEYDPSKETDQLAISCWINWKGLDGAWHGIAGLRDGWDPTTIGWSMVIDQNNGGLQFETNTPDGKVFIITPMPPAENDYTHVALNFDGSFAEYYFNGELVIDGPMEFGRGRSNAGFRIGAAWEDGNGFNGAIDEFRIYNRLLSVDEISALHQYPDGRTGVRDRRLSATSSFELFRNYPNPFNSETRITFSLKESDFITLTVYSILGEVVQVLMDDYRSAGYHDVAFESGDNSSGIYFYQLTGSSGESVVNKMILTK